MVCGGRSILLSLTNRVQWSTRSKALEKSITRQRTYEHLSKGAVTWWSKKDRAHTVLPVGWKANWSTILSALHYITLWAAIAGNIHLETTNLSAIRERRGVTEIGLYSESVLGLATLETSYYRLLPLQRYCATGKRQIQNIKLGPMFVFKQAMHRGLHLPHIGPQLWVHYINRTAKRFSLCWCVITTSWVTLKGVTPPSDSIVLPLVSQTH